MLIHPSNPTTHSSQRIIEHKAGEPFPRLSGLLGTVPNVEEITKEYISTIFDLFLVSGFTTSPIEDLTGPSMRSRWNIQQFYISFSTFIFIKITKVQFEKKEIPAELENSKFAIIATLNTGGSIQRIPVVLLQFPKVPKFTERLHLVTKSYIASVFIPRTTIQLELFSPLEVTGGNTLTVSLELEQQTGNRKEGEELLELDIINPLYQAILEQSFPH